MKHRSSVYDCEIGDWTFETDAPKTGLHRYLKVVKPTTPNLTAYLTDYPTYVPAPYMNFDKALIVLPEAVVRGWVRKS